MKNKKIPIGIIIFIIFLFVLLVTNIVLRIISKNKGVIVLNSSNISEQLKNNRTLGQYFKIEKDTYDVYNQFYVGHSTSTDSGEYSSYTSYDNTYFIIHIKEENTDGYYMAVCVRTEKNKENAILTALNQGKTVDLTGLVSEMNNSYGSTKVIDVFRSALGTNKSNVLEYCINVH